jgi:high-affinity Fe2+/Pb2+ permease
MNNLSKSFKSEPPPLVSLFVVVTSLLCAVFIYQKFFSSGVLDFSPVMMWVAIAIPVGIFGSVFLQIRSTQRTQKVAADSNTRIAALEAELRIGNETRRTTKSNLDRPLPEKDPFENI